MSFCLPASIKQLYHIYFALINFIIIFFNFQRLIDEFFLNHRLQY